MASKLPTSASKLPTPGSRLRPPSKLQPPSTVTPHGKRRVSEEGDSNPFPSKRSCGSLKESNSRLNLAVDENGTSTVMGPPSTVLRRPGGSAAAGRTKMRRSVSMANIAVSKNLRQPGPAPSRGFGSTLSRGNSKLSGSNISLTGRPSSSTSRAPVSGVAGTRRPVTNITHKVNNVVAAAARPPPAKKPGATAPAEKGRSKRPAWDMKGRLQDTEEMVRLLTEQRQNDIYKLSEFNLKLNELHQEKQSLNTDLIHTSSASQEKQAQLEKLQAQLREMGRSSEEERSNLQISIRRLEDELASRERSIKQLTADLDIKIDEINNLKRTVSESLGTQSLMEAKLSSVTAQLRAREERVEELSSELAATRDQVAQLKEEVLQGEYLRKQLHNRVQELKGNIRVYCRIRPLLEEEIRQNGDSDDIHHINVLSESSLELLKGNVGEKKV
ncbi:Spindle pole body-associated protein Vik1/Cik1 microtubule binding domain [Trinorchestia longiramus]|nr:Spindle pole body-associated protein Vik1/Cik1 microtubule binding domain [Trinorchestia longiramus]